jgi:FAD/FMN-containing dehydrogenase
VSRVAELISAGSDELEGAFPGARVVAFGHAGDGNIHWNLFPPPGEQASVGPWSKRVNALAYDIVHRMNGSISAEHGIGVLKRDSLPKYKSALELELMRAVKNALDPRGIMNPGKVI